MHDKISVYLQSRFGSTQNGLEFFQFMGWLFILGITIPLLSPILVLPVVSLTLILFFVLGIVCIVIIWKKGTAIFSTPIDSGMIVIFFTLLITTYFAADPTRSIRTIWQWTALILLFYLLVAVFRLGFSFYPFIKALLFATSIFVLSGYFELYFRLVERHLRQGENAISPLLTIRVSGVMGNPNLLGYFLGIIFVMSAILFIEFKYHRSIWLGGWIAATAILLILTQSRGAWGGVFIAFSVYGLSKVWIKSKLLSFSPKLWGIVLLAIVGGLIAVIVLLMLLRPNTFFVRLKLWHVAIDSWKQYPWTGGGANSYPSLELQRIAIPYGSVMFSHHAHNFYIHTLVEMGVVGLTAVSILTAQIFWMLWQRQEQWNSWTFVFFVSFIAYIAHGQVDYPWLRVNIIIVSFLAAIVVSVTSYKEKIDTASSYRYYLPYFWVFIWFLLVIGGGIGWQRVKQYEDGTAKAVRGEWQAASRAFHAGQLVTPYVDSLFLFASGFSDGVLAFVDTSYLSSAIENQEQWVEREPGWSVNHANLAALYRQAGRKAEAEAEMRQAIAHAPEVPLYYLNLGLWAEEDGEVETAVSLYRQLYHLSRTWHDSPFWQTPLAAQAVGTTPSADTVVDEGFEALVDGRFDEAILIFEESLAENGSSDAYTGLGIAYLYTGEMVKAESAFERAAEYAPRSTIVALWQAALPTAAEGELETAVAELQYQYGVVVGSSFNRYYAAMLFKRRAVPHDFLPQLSCFTFAPYTGMQMQLLEGWYTAVGDVENAAYIDAALLGAGDGLDFCTPVADKDRP